MGATLTNVAARPRGILRHSTWDAVLVGLSGVHALVLFAVPIAPVIAIGLWWNANTIAHNFIHAPFFRARELNTLYSIYLSALLGLPQTLWRHRHLQHHAGRKRPLRISALLLAEIATVVAVWTSIVWFAPDLFVWAYVPGYLAGLGLCFLQGHFEHATGTTSHYGRLYNLCFFNDGYHVEHHLRPGEHWTTLPSVARAGAQKSAWPPVLRWLDAIDLVLLERIALRSSAVQWCVLAAHERAFRRLLPSIAGAQKITIVGGGLFPRTALILQKLLPDATLTIVDKNAAHLDVARRFLNERVNIRRAVYDPHTSDGADLVIVPLAFDGDRDAVYRNCAARATLVHDWMWKRHGEGVPVSWLLLKRLNLVTR